MSIPRNLGNFADNVNTNGKVEVTGINATGTPSSTTVLAGNGSWVTPSAGAMTLISTATASSSATIDFTNLSSTYKTYVIVATNVINATYNAALSLRTSANNGVSYNSGASDYYTTHTNTGVSTWNYGNNLDDRGYINFDGQDNTSGYGGTSFTLTLVNPSATNRTQWYITGFENGTSQTGAFVGGGFRTATTGAVNAIRFFYGTGNIASGTFKLYGIS